MTICRRNALRFIAGVVLLPIAPRTARTQAYPRRPIRLVVGYSAGGNSDITARVIAQWLSSRLGQSVIVENRPGAGSNIAAEAVANSPADGHTLVFMSTASAINATLFNNLKFDIVRDFVPIASLTQYPSVLVANPSFPATTIPEFIAHAKANPGKINIGISAVGSMFHLAGELFKARAGINLNNVPFRGSAPMLTAIFSGHVQIAFDSELVGRVIQNEG